MKKKALLLLLIICLLVPFSACEKTETVSFGSSDLLVSSFDGLGVEWGTYEDTNKLVNGAWDRVLEAVDRLNPSIIRCMTNLDWYVVDFDNNDTPYDPTDDKWNYNFNNKNMVNTTKILDYCEAHGIQVAFGVWNVIGNVDPDKDLYGMIYRETEEGYLASEIATADPRWPMMNADLMEYLIKVKGYTCIKWFVNTNEPNMIGEIGQSKNAYSNYEIWETGMKNLRAAFDSIGLRDLALVGGDTTKILPTRTYLTNIARNIPNIVNNYGFHYYADANDLMTGAFQKYLEDLYARVQVIDSELGTSKKMYIWEAGIFNGKNEETDSNGTILNYTYGLRMADYTLQSIAAGLNGIVYWDLDDAMYFTYRDNVATPKEWGMFSTLATSDSQKQEYRPWYHASVLLTNLFRPGYSIFSKDTGKEGVRAMAALSPDRTRGGYVVVNHSKSRIKQKMQISEKVEAGTKLYVYYYSEKYLKIGADGYVEPNYEIEGTLNREITLEIPANTFAVVSNVRL